MMDHAFFARGFQITVFIMASHLTGERDDLMIEHNNARTVYVGQCVARSPAATTARLPTTLRRCPRQQLATNYLVVSIQFGVISLRIFLFRHVIEFVGNFD